MKPKKKMEKSSTLSLPAGIKENLMPGGIKCYMGLALVLASAAFVLPSLSTEEKPVANRILDVTAIPLSNENLESWVGSSEELSENKVGETVHTLPELIYWGRINSEVLDASLSQSDAPTYLGITVSIDQARRNYRNQVEHELRLEETELMMEAIDGLADNIYSPPLPDLGPTEQNDLDAYLENEVSVENTLYRLMPGMPVLVPAWDIPFDPELEGEVENPTKPIPMKWRSINRSRYGPRILRR